jgi:hypothetical protein
MKRIVIGVLIGIGVVVGVFLLIQLIPVPRDNPPVVTAVQWDSPQTQALWTRARADCHSNETVWPWYSKIAPVSWLVSFDVSRGRSHLNLSELSASSPRFSRISSEISHAIQEGEMPPGQYLLMHPSGKLSSAETQALMSGLQTTLTNMQGK